MESNGNGDAKMAQRLAALARARLSPRGKAKVAVECSCPAQGLDEFKCIGSACDEIKTTLAQLCDSCRTAKINVERGDSAAEKETGQGGYSGEQGQDSKSG